MKKTIIFAGFMGFLLTGVASATTTVATVKHVDRNVDTVNAHVVELNNRASTDNTTVNGHTSDISSLNTNKQVVPTNANECQNLDSTRYSGCGYISASGTTGAYRLVKIVKPESSGTPAVVNP